MRHSGISMWGVQVIAQCVEGTEHEATFVAGYLAGGYLPVDLFGTVFKNLHMYIILGCCNALCCVALYCAVS